jgi:3-oxoacyl-[acyl-carrier-protein] synthase II
LLLGRSGVRRLEAEWAQGLPVGIGAPVLDDPADVLGATLARKLDRVQQLALVAAREAWADAGSPLVDPDRLAVVMGSGVGGYGTLLQQHDNISARGSRGVTPQSLTMFMPDSAAVTVGLELHARAGVHTPVSACASGAEAVAYGLDLIRLGRADIVVVGGAEASVHRLPIAGFASIRALSTRQGDPREASRPFDAGRDGFVLGEGAAILVLETEEHAARRGWTAYATLEGAAVSADAYHAVAPDPKGAGAARAMCGALRDAGEGPGAVVHVNAHATSTPLGDIAESLAIRSALGQRAGSVPVTGTKSMTGHLLGASGALAAVITVLSLSEGLVPATQNLDVQDGAIDLDVVHGAPRPLDPGLALSNSFGFGGHNVSLAFGPGADGRHVAAAASEPGLAA